MFSQVQLAQQLPGIQGIGCPVENSLHAIKPVLTTVVPVAGT